jgi:hypothetical protein
MLLARVVDHLETFCLPQATPVPIAGELESWRAGEREGDRPLEPKTGTHNVRWVSHSGVPLSCPATGSPPGTPPRPRLKTTTGGLPRDRLGTPTEVNVSLLTRTLPLAPEVGTAQRGQTFSPHADLAVQTDITSKGLRDSEEERGEPQPEVQVPLPMYWRHRHTDAHLSKI